MCCPRYDISQGEFVRPADIDVAEGCIVSVIPDIRFEGNIVIATAKPEPFEEFCASFLRSGAKKKPRTGGTGCKKASTATVRDRVRAEFPWLTDADIKAFEGEQEDDAEGSGAIAGEVRRVDWEAVEDEAFLDVMDRLADRREEWAFEDDQLHFYIILPGGMWTEVHTGAVSDSAKCNARSHVKQWCKEFGWPQSKQFMFSAHGLDGANELAREWCRKGNFFFQEWRDSAGSEDFDLSAGCTVEYEENLGFVSWAADVPFENERTWQAIMALRRAWPKKAWVSATQHNAGFPVCWADWQSK